MNQEDPMLEENVARLVRAAASAAAHPTPELRQQVFQQLREALRNRTAPVRFPDGLLVGLGLALSLAGGWSLLSLIGVLPSSTENPLVLLIAVGLLFNLALVPVAGIVIVKRRD
jgi:hypothetical protein